MRLRISVASTVVFIVLVLPGTAAAQPQADTKESYAPSPVIRSLTIEPASTAGATPRHAPAGRPHLKILFLASEVAPFAKTGGLADVAGSLPKGEALPEWEIFRRIGLALAPEEQSFAFSEVEELFDQMVSKTPALRSLDWSGIEQFGVTGAPQGS